MLQICGECGKGFYRKDHLRKHAKSHATKRLKEEMNAAAAASQSAAASTNATPTTQAPVLNSIVQSLENSGTENLLQQLQQQQMIQLQTGDSQTICLHVSKLSIFHLECF